MMKTAIEIGRHKDWTGDARIYRLSSPIKYYDWRAEKEKQSSYVVVSATIAPYSGPETFIFACNKKGEVKNFSELNGSFRGDLCHASALEGAGFKIEEE